MSKLEDKELVPELRFSGFNGDWFSIPISKMGKVVTGNTPSTSNREYYDGKYLFVTPADISDSRFVERTKSTLTTEGFNKSRVIKSGSILFVCIGSTIGKVAQVKCDCATNQQINAITAFKGCSNDFLYYLLSFHALDIAELAGKQAVPIINKTAFSEIVLLLPQEQEQQKIADCLASIDDLITANTKKLESLKSHKKGLMQKLFPAEGKSVPELRFSGFDGDWKENKLNQITTSIFDGTHQTPKYTEEGIPFFSVENIVSGKENKFISVEDYKIATSRNKPMLDDVLITRIGKIGFSKVVDWGYDFSIYVTLAVIKKDIRFNSQFLHGYMQAERYQKELQRKSLLNAVPCKINMDELRKTEVMLPSSMNEQQKIADCLSSMDDLIKAQSEKIETLKSHKKGLMQRLFPVLEGLAS